MTYQMSSLFSPLFCVLFVFAAVSLRDPFHGELGKNTVAKSTSGQRKAPERVPGVPRQLSWAWGHCTQTVHRTTPTIYRGLRGGRPSCVSSFCHGNTDYWICLDAVCLSSGPHGWLELYLGSLCWKNGRAGPVRAVICWRCRAWQWPGCSAFSHLPARTPRTRPATLLGSRGTDGRAAVWGFCMVSHRNRRH